MTRCCEFTGKRVLVGNNVSHANNRTKRRFLPNIQKTRFYSDSMKTFYAFRVSVAAIRTVDKKGGLDNFLTSTKNEKLSGTARTLKSKIKEKLNDASPEKEVA